MTCGRKDWEPVSGEITVRASQTDACKLERVHRFRFYSSFGTGLAAQSNCGPEAAVLRHGRAPNFSQRQDFRQDFSFALLPQRSRFSFAPVAFCVVRNG